MIARTLAAAGGAVVAAVGAAACCAPPLLVSALGLSSAGLGGALEPYRPAFLSASGALFLLGFFWVRRDERKRCRCEPEAEEPAGEESCDTCATAGHARVLLWIAIVASVAVAYYPEWSAWL